VAFENKIGFAAPHKNKSTFSLLTVEGSSHFSRVMIALKVHYEGRVQGVGFRFSTKQIAMGYEIRGSVANLPDGRVELCVAGTAGEVEEFLLAIRESHLASCIRKEQTFHLPDPSAVKPGFAIVA